MKRDGWIFVCVIVWAAVGAAGAQLFNLNVPLMAAMGAATGWEIGFWTRDLEGNKKGKEK